MINWICRYGFDRIPNRKSSSEYSENSVKYNRLDIHCFIFNQK